MTQSKQQQSVPEGKLEQQSITEGRLPAVRRRRKRPPFVSFAILSVLLACALFAPWLAPHSPTEIDPTRGRLPPDLTSQFLLGTDVLGRDVLSRLIYGARTSMLIAVLGLAVSVLVGTIIGIVAGYYGQSTDAWLMRIVDVVLAFPTVLAALLIAAVMGIGAPTLIVAITITMWAKTARMMRGDALSIRKADYVRLAQVAGVSTPMILLRHILPNVVGTLMVITTVLLGQVILLTASLSFLGLGLPPGAPDWGVMIAEGQDYLAEMWWLSLFPGVALTLVVMSTTFVGEWARGALDPRMQVL